MSKYQSNALWPNGGITTDLHDTLEQSAAVCRELRRKGLGGEGKCFPKFVWTSPPQQPPKLPKYWNWEEPPNYYNPREALK